MVADGVRVKSTRARFGVRPFPVDWASAPFPIDNWDVLEAGDVLLEFADEGDWLPLAVPEELLVL